VLELSPVLLTFCPDRPGSARVFALCFLVVLIKFFEHRVFGELVWLDTSGPFEERKISFQEKDQANAKGGWAL